VVLWSGVSLTVLAVTAGWAFAFQEVIAQAREGWQTAFSQATETSSDLLRQAEQERLRLKAQMPEWQPSAPAQSFGVEEAIEQLILDAKEGTTFDD
jgi:hypothetical protein